MNRKYRVTHNDDDSAMIRPECNSIDEANEYIRNEISKFASKFKILEAPREYQVMFKDISDIEILEVTSILTS